MSGHDYVSKVAGIWFPTFTFISVGFDHVVMNMFFVSMAIFQGAPTIMVGLYIWKGIIPALIRNIIGGGFLVGAFYWHLHLASEPPCLIDGVYFERLGGVELNPSDRGIFDERRKKRDEESVLGDKDEDSRPVSLQAAPAGRAA